MTQTEQQTVRREARAFKARLDEKFLTWMRLDNVAERQRVNGVIYGNADRNAEAQAAWDEYDALQAEFDAWRAGLVDHPGPLEWGDVMVDQR